MAEDTLNHVERILGKRQPCSTRKTPLADRNPQLLDSIRSNASLGVLPLHSTLTEGDVVYAVRHEAAIHLVDVLTRRSRLHLCIEILQWSVPNRCHSSCSENSAGQNRLANKNFRATPTCVTLKSMQCVKEFSNANNTYSPY